MQNLPTISEHKLDKIAEGFFSEVFKVRDADLVIKIPKKGARHLHEIENRIYQRIGVHPNILTCLGERQVAEASGLFIAGLCFAYEPQGTLHELLSERDKSTCQHPSLNRIRTLLVVSHLPLPYHLRWTNGICTY